MPGKQFDYMLSNPPFGVEWKKVEKEVRKEHEQQGFNGRFGPGLPRVCDGSLLFLLHLLSKMRPAKDGGSRFGIVLNGSPLFTGGAGSGESEIRRYVLENDLRRGHHRPADRHVLQHRHRTYVWIVSQPQARRRARARCSSSTPAASGRRCARASAPSARRAEHIADAHRRRSRATLFGEHCRAEVEAARPEGGKCPISRIFRNEDFGYRTITVERPLRDEAGQDRAGRQGQGRRASRSPTPTCATPRTCRCSEDVETYFKREVLPHAPDAWIDHEKTKVGYEIPFNRHFYVFKPPRPLAEIDAELKQVTDRILTMIGGLAA